MPDFNQQRLRQIGADLEEFAERLESYLSKWEPLDHSKPAGHWNETVSGILSTRRQKLWWKYAVPCGALLIEGLREGLFWMDDPKLRQRLLSHFGSLKQRHQAWFAAAKTFTYGANYHWLTQTHSVRMYREITYFWAETFPQFLRAVIAAARRE